MNRIASMIISVLILIMLLSSCSSSTGVDITSLNSSGGSKEESPDITIESPMTLSNNDLYPVIGEHQYLRLKMVKGKYYEDWTPGAYMGTIWEGYFIIELSDESGNVISQN